MPTTVQAVELKEMRSCCGTAFGFVEMKDIETIVCAQIALGTLDTTQCCTERQSADPSYTVDANLHALYRLSCDALTALINGGKCR